MSLRQLFTLDRIRLMEYFMSCDRTMKVKDKIAYYLWRNKVKTLRDIEKEVKASIEEIKEEYTGERRERLLDMAMEIFEAVRLENDEGDTNNGDTENGGSGDKGDNGDKGETNNEDNGDKGETNDEDNGDKGETNDGDTENKHVGGDSLIQYLSHFENPKVLVERVAMQPEEKEEVLFSPREDQNIIQKVKFHSAAARIVQKTIESMSPEFSSLSKLKNMIQSKEYVNWNNELLDYFKKEVNVDPWERTPNIIYLTLLTKLVDIDISSMKGIKQRCNAQELSHYAQKRNQEFSNVKKLYAKYLNLSNFDVEFLELYSFVLLYEHFHEHVSNLFKKLSSFLSKCKLLTKQSQKDCVLHLVNTLQGNILERIKEHRRCFDPVVYGETLKNPNRQSEAKTALILNLKCLKVCIHIRCLVQQCSAVDVFQNEVSKAIELGIQRMIFFQQQTIESKLEKITQGRISGYYLEGASLISLSEFILEASRKLSTQFEDLFDQVVFHGTDVSYTEIVIQAFTNEFYGILNEFFLKMADHSVKNKDDHDAIGLSIFEHLFPKISGTYQTMKKILFTIKKKRRKRRYSVQQPQDLSNSFEVSCQLVEYPLFKMTYQLLKDLINRHMREKMIGYFQSFLQSDVFTKLNRKTALFSSSCFDISFMTITGMKSVLTIDRLLLSSSNEESHYQALVFVYFEMVYELLIDYCQSLEELSDQFMHEQMEQDDQFFAETQTLPSVQEGSLHDLLKVIICLNNFHGALSQLSTAVSSCSDDLLLLYTGIEQDESNGIMGYNVMKKISNMFGEFQINLETRICHYVFKRYADLFEASIWESDEIFKSRLIDGLSRFTQFFSDHLYPEVFQNLLKLLFRKYCDEIIRIILESTHHSGSLSGWTKRNKKCIDSNTIGLLMKELKDLSFFNGSGAEPEFIAAESHDILVIMDLYRAKTPEIIDFYDVMKKNHLNARSQRTLDLLESILKCRKKDRSAQNFLKNVKR